MDSPSESEDEDVILPSSPLCQYFKESEAVEDRSPNTESIESQNFQRTVIEACKSNINMMLSAIREIFSFYFHIFYNFFQKKHCELQKRVFFSVLHAAEERRILIPEDSAFLQNFFSDVNSSGNVHSFSESRLITILFMSCSVLILYFYGVHFENYLCIVECETSRKIIRRLTIFLAAFNFACFSYWGLLFLYYLLKCYRVCNKTKKLCFNVKDLIDTFKKSYRIIQEVELIARGFISASVTNVAQRLEMSSSLPIKSPSRQLPEFRKSLFIWTNNMFLQYRQVTSNLIELTPLPAECSSQYFATMPLEDFGDLVKLDPISVEDFDQLLKVSENFSLSSLKTVHQLFIVQVSEFFKRFSLCFCHELHVSAVNYFIAFEKLDAYMNLLEKAMNHNSKILSCAKQAYMLYRNMGGSGSTDKMPFHSSCSKTSPLHDFVVNLHDLNLHLKAALMKVTAIEDCVIEEISALEKQSENSSVLKESSVERLKLFLKEIEAELSFTKECFSDCCNFVDNGFSSRVCTGTNQNEISPPLPCITSVPSKLPEIISDSDPIIEDEVYEAVVHASQSDYKETSNTGFGSGDGDDKIDKKLTVHLMKELKQILVVKAEEHRCREEKALQAKAARTKCSSDVDVQLENSCDHSVATPSDHEMGDKTHNTNSEEDTLKSVLNYDESDDNQCSFTKIKSRSIGSELHKEDKSSLDLEQSRAEIVETAAYSDAKERNDSFPFRFNVSGNVNFAASVAEMALQRQQLFNLHDDTFECHEEVIGDDDDDDESAD